MADEPKSDPMQMVWLIVGVVGILVFLWFATGAYKNTDIRGLFLAPPAPVGSGGAYGPQIGNPNPNYETNQQNQ